MAIEVISVADSPSALILDDGELDDVQLIFEGLGVEFARVRGGAIVSDTAPPKALLVSTPRRISAVAESGHGDEDPPIRIVVTEEDSTTLRDQLREIGFDYIVRRPVHPEALRLLLMHGLYRGEERRREPRVAVGLDISFRTGELPRRATLVDLSTRGCRLLSNYALEANSRIQVQLPEAIGATELLSLEGRVSRSEVDDRIRTDDKYTTAVVFENLSADLRHELEWIIEDKTAGPPILRETEASDLERAEEASAGTRSDTAKPTVGKIPLRRKRRSAIVEKVSPSCPPDPRSESAAEPPQAPSSSASETVEEFEPVGVPVEVKMRGLDEDPPEMPEEDPESASEADDDRRSMPRHPFGANVPAFGSRALRVLVGRDLGMGGMRIAHHPDLEVNDRLHLAIYGDAGEDPFLVWSTVSRNDGDSGMALVFDPIHPTVAERLEKLVASLPSVEFLHDDEAAAMGSVLSEILNE